jgi:ATP-binding cassette subfamily B (MDR/TAP) protein 1
MIMGFIGSVASGASNPLMAYLTGSTTSDASESSEDRLDTMTEEEKRIFFAEFKKTMNKKVREFMIYGAASFVAAFMSNFFWEYAALRQMHHLKEKYFARILMQEQGWFDQNNAFEFATKVQVQLEQIELGVGEKFGTLIECASTFITGLIIAFFASWKLTLIILCVSPFLAGCIIYMVTSMRKSLFLSRKAYETAGGVAEEVLYNIKTVVSFGNFDFERQRFGHYIDLVHKLDKQSGFKLAISTAGVNFFYFLSYFVCLMYAKSLLSKENPSIKPGDVMTVCFATTMAVASFGMMAPNISIIQEACVAASDYFTLLDREPVIDETNSTYMPPRDNVMGRIEFKNIEFIYPSDENKRKILDGLNLVFEPGQKVALVGESGCGKSTTVNLIERLYEPTAGEVLIDGVNVKDYDLKYLRSLIGYVQQEPVLFNSPIRNNIIFGRDELIQKEFGGDTDRLIHDACKEAYAKEFIEKIPEKYNYVVGIKGSKLSGGQKQRIAIARAILCKPKILILDEATSALDNKSEKQVQRALDNISKKNVTTVIIAHRLSTIQNADVIYAIRNGKVCEKGTHEELLQLNGYYAGLVKSQMTGDDKKTTEKLNKKHSSLYSVSSYNNEEINDDNVGKIKEKPKRKLIEVQRSRIFALYFNIFFYMKIIY